MNSMLKTSNSMPCVALAKQGPFCSAKATQNTQFLSRIFTDASGRQFRLTFLVTMVDGELKGRLVSAEPMQRVALEGSPQTESSFCLPIICSDKKPNTEYVFNFAPVVSPYFSLEFLINSQPTRAPSHK